MQSNKEVIGKFYAAFQKLDWLGMISCYHDEVFFYDPVFENLEAGQVRSMWQMLCHQAKDFSLTYKDIRADKEYGSCKWTATYTFSRTGRKVVNHVKANFRFQNGKIIEHMDDFDLWKWSRQALGISGWVLGWSPVIKKRIRKMARGNLGKFMKSG
jgi:hypothetical protein